jgi:hypothetical protein
MTKLQEHKREASAELKGTSFHFQSHSACPIYEQRSKEIYRTMPIWRVSNKILRAIIIFPIRDNANLISSFFFRSHHWCYLSNKSRDFFLFATCYSSRYPRNIMYTKTHADLCRLEAVRSNLEWHLDSTVPKFAELKIWNVRYDRIYTDIQELFS